MQNSRLFFSHVLHPPRPWTSRFGWPVFNRIPPHMAAPAALLLPPQLRQRRCEGPGRSLPGQSSAAPTARPCRSPAGAAERGLQGCTSNPRLRGVSTNESELLCCCCFSSGQPPPKSLLRTARARLRSPRLDPGG